LSVAARAAIHLQGVLMNGAGRANRWHAAVLHVLRGVYGWRVLELLGAGAEE
jgi:hypothetical protein